MFPESSDPHARKRHQPSWPVRFPKLLRYLSWRNVLLAAIALGSLGYAGWIFAPFVMPPEVVWDESIPKEKRKVIAASLDELRPGWKRGGVAFDWERVKWRVTGEAGFHNRVEIRAIEGPGPDDDPPGDGRNYYEAGRRRSAMPGPVGGLEWLWLIAGPGEWILHMDHDGGEASPCHKDGVFVCIRLFPHFE